LFVQGRREVVAVEQTETSGLTMTNVNIEVFIPYKTQQLLSVNDKVIG
jgi:hypothetical protein